MTRRLRPDAAACRGLLLPIRRLLTRLVADRSGVGAVEFAIIAPVLLVLYLCAFETTLLLSDTKRATRAAGSVADLVTQSDTINKATLATMVNVTQALFAPYAVTNLKLKISGITIDAASKATIAWSWAQDGSKPYSVGATATIPADLLKANTFVVHSELSVDHTLAMFLANTLSYNTSTVTINRDFYYRQRVGSGVTCSDC